MNTQHPDFYNDLDFHSAYTDGRVLSYGEIEDRERTARANDGCSIDLDLLTCLESGGAARIAEATFALFETILAQCGDEDVRDVVGEIVEAKEEDFRTGGATMACRRALDRHRRLVQEAERYMRMSPRAMAPEATALVAAARLGANDLREALRFAYLSAIRLDYAARERCDDPLDLPDDPNETLRTVLGEEERTVLADLA